MINGLPMNHSVKQTYFHFESSRARGGGGGGGGGYGVTPTLLDTQLGGATALSKFY